MTRKALDLEIKGYGNDWRGHIQYWKVVPDFGSLFFTWKGNVFFFFGRMYVHLIVVIDFPFGKWRWPHFNLELNSLDSLLFFILYVCSFLFNR